MSPAAACRISTASPCHPGPQPAPGCDVYEASARVHWRSPHASLPLTCGPGGTGPLGFPWAPHPAEQDPATHARAGTGSDTARTTSLASASLLRRTHSPRATSRRNNQSSCRRGSACAPRTQVRLAAPSPSSPAAAAGHPGQKGKSPPPNTPTGPTPFLPRPPGMIRSPGSRIKDALQAPATPAGLPPGP